MESQQNYQDVIFTIGRMNPPTPGHKKLIKQMMHDAIIDNIPIIHIILSSTTGFKDGKMNPLECEEKRYILYGGMLDKIKAELASEYPGINPEALKVEVICMDDPIPSEFGSSPVLKTVNYMLSRFYPDKPKKARIYLGDDELHKFDWIQQYLPQDTVWDPKGVSRPAGDISATELRNLTIDNRDHFIDAMTKLAREKQKVFTPKQLDDLYENRLVEFKRHMADIGIKPDEAVEFYNKIGVLVNDELRGGKEKIRGRKTRRGIHKKHKRRNTKKKTKKRSTTNKRR